MKIFLSWGGERSKVVGAALRDLLPEVLQDIEIWMSENDIMPGQRWGHELAATLEECEVGVVCLTKENLSSPWILFEAGCLAKSVTASRVIPYILDLSPTDITFP